MMHWKRVKGRFVKKKKDSGVEEIMHKNAEVCEDGG